MSKQEYSPSYEITPQTIAVLAVKGESGKTKSLVLEESAEYGVLHAPSRVIDNACKYFGSSLKGRQEGTKEVSGLTHKAPISIDPSSGMYFFPTASPMNSNCSWIAHTHIRKIKEAANQCTELIFNNGMKIVVDVSIGSMMNQIQRTAQFRYVLDNRIKNLHGKNFNRDPDSFS